MGDFVKVNLGKNKPSIKIEKGCSFENNGAIYYVDSDGQLNVYDKKTSIWSVGKSININNYQLNALKAIANNSIDLEDNEPLDGIVLSKNDIRIAMTLHKESKLTGDLSELLNGTTYKAENVSRYTDANAISAYITNGEVDTSANLVFKYGAKEEAVALSDYIKNQKTQDGFFSKIKSFFTKAEKPQEVKDITVQAPVEVVQETQAQELVDKSVPVQQMPEYYDRKLNSVAKKMGLSKEALKDEISRVAENSGYSEYFITHLVSLENYEKTVRNTNDGTITGGFGHSKKLDKNLKEDAPVSPKQAFDWLEEDIKYFENQLKTMKINQETGETFGDYFDDMPLSLKEGLLDVAFNRTASKLENASEYKDLRDDICKGNYAFASVNICQNLPYTFDQAKKHKFTTGLMERNVYRFLLAIRDLDPVEKDFAKSKFKEERYYDMAIALKKAKGHELDASLMQTAWNPEETK